MARASYKRQPAPGRVSLGSVSRPAKRGKWNPKKLAIDKLKRVKAGGTSANG